MTVRKYTILWCVNGQKEDGFETNRRSCIDRLQKLPRDSEFVQLRLACTELSLFLHSRPDISVTANKMEKNTEDSFDSTHVKQFNTAVKYLCEILEISVRMCKLDTETLRIRVYTDASYPTSQNYASQIGYIVLLCDENDNAFVLRFASYRSRRVARFVVGTETFAFADAYDFANCSKHDLESAIDRRVTLMMLTDSKKLFDAITKFLQTEERRLIIDLQSVRD